MADSMLDRPDASAVYERSVAPKAPLVLYDAECPFCTRQATLLQRITPRRAFLFVPLQSPGLREILPPALTPERLRAQMHVIEPDGRYTAGAAAVARILKTVPIVGLLAHLYEVPLIRPLADRLYVWVARNRYRLFGRQPACVDSCQRIGGTD